MHASLSLVDGIFAQPLLLFPSLSSFLGTITLRHRMMEGDGTTKLRAHGIGTAAAVRVSA